MCTIEIHLFGRFEMCVGSQVVNGFVSQKALELFCFLLLNRDRPHHREQLAETFWNNRSINESRKCFRKTIWQLQSTLDNIPIENCPQFLLVEPDWLQFNQQMDIWLDVYEFTKTYSSIIGTRGREMDEKKYQDAKYAEMIYKGDLLQGWYQDWCLFERERLKDIYSIVVEKLIGYCEANQKYEIGINYGRKLLSWDPARESTHVRLMRLYYAMGERTSALRQFELCRNILREEFNVEPDEATIDLYRQIAGDNFDLANQNNFILHNIDTTSSNQLKSLRRIKELVTTQADLSRQVKVEIMKLEEALESI